MDTQQQIAASLRRALSRLAAATIVATVAACGGGGGGGGDDDEDPRSTPLPPLSQEQAMDVAARTAHAVFVYDSAASVVLWGGMQPVVGRLSPAQPTRRFDMSCTSGSGRVDFTDADTSASITAGDSAVIVLEDCSLPVDGSRMYTGTAELSIVAGTNIENHWSGLGAGESSVLVSFEPPMALGDHEELLGRYTLDTSSSSGTDLRQRIHLPDLRVNGGASPIGFRGVEFEVSPDMAIATMTGTVVTEVAGLPALEAELSVVDALQIGAADLRYRPRSGTLRIDLADQVRRVDVGWTGLDAMQLQVDEGADSSADLEVPTTPAALDARLRSTEPVPR